MLLSLSVSRKYIFVKTRGDGVSNWQSPTVLGLIEDNPSDKIAIVEEELDGIDRDDIGN